MQAPPVRDCANGYVLLVSFLNKFCKRSERIIQSISDISRDYRA